MNKIEIVKTIEEYNNLVDCELQSLPRVIFVTKDVMDYVMTETNEKDNSLISLLVIDKSYELNELVDDVCQSQEIENRAVLMMFSYNYDIEKQLTNSLIKKMYDNNIILLVINE